MSSRGWELSRESSDDVFRPLTVEALMFSDGLCGAFLSEEGGGTTVCRRHRKKGVESTGERGSAVWALSFEPYLGLCLAGLYTPLFGL
ncbi:hypothetical protein L1887_22587 [Cichorium endivia]|nr:hypothetical protein L1887_22587 [Cichorium endivia]